MSINFILPDIGEGIVECELVEWLVKEGDVIVEDQPIADVMTDKALVHIPAMHSGLVEKLYYKQGEIAKVHSPLFAMTPEGDTSTNDTIAVTTEPEVKAQVDIVKAALAGREVSPPSGAPSSVKSEPIVSNTKIGNGKILASPAVRRVARELGINIHQVEGSGKKGRVYKEDVVAYSRNGSSVVSRVIAGSTVIRGTNVEDRKRVV